MDSNLYFLADGKAVMIAERNYDQEDDLQVIIANNPALLLRSYELEDNSIFLVKREFNISEGIDSGNSYSLDILLVDQSAIPVLVEVKRSSDTRIRREVVAQMLDYACRASIWNVNLLRESFRANNEDTILRAYDTDEFWGRVSNNLQSENLRLIFAADHIPDTLKQLIDFLNRNMPSVEVYGAEIRRFKSGSITVLSSSIVGDSANMVTSLPQSIEWDADSFAKCLFDRGNDRACAIAEELRRYATEVGLSCSFGRGSKFPSFSAKYQETTLFKVVSWSNKRDGFRVLVELCVPALLNRLGGGWSDAYIRHLLSNISPVGRCAVTDGAKYLYIDLELLTDKSNMVSFKDFVSKMCETIIGSTVLPSVNSPDPQAAP